MAVNVELLPTESLE